MAACERCGHRLGVHKPGYGACAAADWEWDDTSEDPVETLCACPAYVKQESERRPFDEHEDDSHRLSGFRGYMS